jgi:HSP20 family protein
LIEKIVPLKHKIVMTLIRNSDLIPVQSLLTDFFNADRFLNSDLLDIKRLSNALPAVNIKETEKEFDLEVAVPGFNRNDFKIDVLNDILTISAIKEEEKNEDGKDYKRREFKYNSFERSFTLPKTINADAIKADYKGGILKLVLPKNEEVKHLAKKEIKVS